jgi:hypothetical protein
MDLSVEPSSQDSGISAEPEQKAASQTVSGYCDATYNTQLDPDDARPCSRHAKQICANCDAKLCDLHAEFCAICLAFFCDGCLDLHKQEGQHADGSIGDLVAIVREGVQG